jgi:hypothetical protein
VGADTVCVIRDTLGTMTGLPTDKSQRWERLEQARL